MNRLRAGPKRARWKMLLAVICIVLPSSTVGAYEFGVAADQYVSQFAFVVREQTPMMMEPNSVMPSLAGGNPLLEMIEDSEVVKRYIESPQILMDLQDKFSLPAVYGMPRGDWWSRMDTNGSRETKLRYWDDMVTPYFDISSGIITVQVRAFTPHDAAMVAAEVLAASEALVNRMSATTATMPWPFPRKMPPRRAPSSSRTRSHSPTTATTTRSSSPRSRHNRPRRSRSRSATRLPPTRRASPR